MKYMLLLIGVVFLVGSAWTQDWQVIKSGGAEYFPNGGFFFNADSGWLVGDNGVVQKTEDGAISRIVARYPDGSGKAWRDVAFSSSKVGYACGDGGVIYKTSDGGYNWVMMGDTVQYKKTLYGVAVINDLEACFAGAASTFLKTIDGGKTFTKSSFNFGKDLNGGIAFTNEWIGVVANSATGGKTWYTHDGGATWNAMALKFPAGTTGSKIYDIAATGDSTIIIGAYNYCVFISTDGGMNYSVSGNYTSDFKYHNSVDAVDTNIVVAGGLDGHVVKTDDGGKIWTNIDIPCAQTIKFVDFVSADVGYVFAASGQWFKTTNGGVSWVNILDWPNITFYGLALPSDHKIALSAWGGGEFTMSNDNGMNWLYPTNLATGMKTNIYECEFSDSLNGLIGGNYGDLRKTTDGGLTWNYVDNPMAQGGSLHINALRYLNENLVFVAGSKGTIMRSNDGGVAWDTLYLNNQYSRTIYDLNPLANSQLVAVADKGEIYLSNTSLDSFRLAEDVGEMVLRAVEFQKGIGLIASSGGTIFRSATGDAKNWTVVFTETEGNDLYDLEFVNDSLVFAAGKNGKLYKSLDAGLNWSAEMSPVTATLQKIRYRNYKLWAAGENGTILLNDMTPPPPPPVIPITGLFINEFMAGNMLANADEFGEYDSWIEIYNATDTSIDVGGLYVTDDLANPFLWQISDTNSAQTTIPAGGFLMLWADKQPGQGVRHVDLKLKIEGEQIGLIQMIDSLPHYIDSLSFSPQNQDTSYGRTNDGGSQWAFFRPASPGFSNTGGTIVSIELLPAALITEYRLEQNFPNPFNPITHIEFSIREAGVVKLTVYNARGQKVAALLNKHMDVGAFKIIWNAGELASGLYFYELTSSDYRSVRKLMLIK